MPFPLACIFDGFHLAMKKDRLQYVMVDDVTNRVDLPPSSDLRFDPAEGIEGLHRDRIELQGTLQHEAEIFRHHPIELHIVVVNEPLPIG